VLTPGVMPIFLVVGSLVLFLAALVLAVGGRPGSGSRDESFTTGSTAGFRRERRGEKRRVLITLVRGKDFFERRERPGGN